MPGLELVCDFLNTLDERSFVRHRSRHPGGDALTSAAALDEWLAGHGLARGGARASAADLRAAVDLRAALREALRLRDAARNDGGADEVADAVAWGDAALTEMPLRIGFDGELEPSLLPVRSGASAGLAAIAVAVALAPAAGTWHRLKMCAAPDCHWVFYDRSRNGGGRWCSMGVCGNRDKTRTYRQRHGT